MDYFWVQLCVFVIAMIVIYYAYKLGGSLWGIVAAIIVFIVAYYYFNSILVIVPF